MSPAFAVALPLLLFSRLLSTLSLSLRAGASQAQWHGASEPGVRGDLLVLMSADRWVRMRGLVDDLKAVTSGAWLAAPGAPRWAVAVEAMQWTARMLVYIVVVVLASPWPSPSPSLGTKGQADEREVNTETALLVAAVVVGHLVLMAENAWRGGELVMNGRRIRVAGDGEKGGVKRYQRRLDMAEELVREVRRRNFAVRLGMLNPEEKGDGEGTEATATKKKKSNEKKRDPGTEVVTM